MTFDEWFAGWVKALPEWNDAAGNYETIASEAWEHQERTLEELREEAVYAKARIASQAKRISTLEALTKVLQEKQ